MKKFLRYTIELPIALIAFLIIAIDDLIWDKVIKVVAFLRQLKYLDKFGHFIANSNPWVAALSFVIPVVILFPIKLLAVMAIAKGKIFFGGSLYVSLKIIGAACLKWLFSYAEAPLMSVKWINKTVTFVVVYKNKIKAWAVENIYIKKGLEAYKKVKLFLLEKKKEFKLFKEEKRTYFKFKLDAYKKFVKMKKTAKTKV